MGRGQYGRVGNPPQQGPARTRRQVQWVDIWLWLRREGNPSTG
ncbi:MAG TPA: hypothetical protein VF498_05855 [Anaerolineales bacterium]